MTRVTHTWDHPRSRGVYQPTGLSGLCGEGSSPLARGLRDRLAQAPAQAGIIPARAGFTTHNGVVGRSVPDHPRSRGVYLTRYVTQSSYSGSSPLARGLRSPSAPALRPAGIIPARAGFTPRPDHGAAPDQDHPRSRGVYPSSGGSAPGTPGSSPLARGLHGRHLDRPDSPGIIPARAGFTDAQARRRRPQRDHPRSRGVYTTCSLGRACAPGSSPLARGLRRP